MDYVYESADALFEAKAEARKNAAKATIEQKLRTIVKLQRMNYAVKTSAGRTAPRPWGSEEAKSGDSTIRPDAEGELKRRSQNKTAREMRAAQ